MTLPPLGATYAFGQPPSGPLPPLSSLLLTTVSDAAPAAAGAGFAAAGAGFAAAGLAAGAGAGAALAWARTSAGVLEAATKQVVVIQALAVRNRDLRSVTQLVLSMTARWAGVPNGSGRTSGRLARTRR